MGTKLRLVDPPDDLARLHETAVAVNEALVISSVRQHELTEAAESLSFYRLNTNTSTPRWCLRQATIRTSNVKTAFAI